MSVHPYNPQTDRQAGGCVCECDLPYVIFKAVPVMADTHWAAQVTLFPV